MDKDTLRNNLFEKYFENEEGILVLDLVNKLSFIPEVWKKLHKLCEENIEYFSSYSSLNAIRVEQINCKKYLILEFGIANYVIIDLEKKKNITKEQFINDFNENFFIDKFHKTQLEKGTIFLDWYCIEEFNNVKELIDFYIANETTLQLSSKLYYSIYVNNSWTYFCIDFVNATSQLGFQTPDQFLYEHLYLNYDLTASVMQDAQSKIGLEKMYEMFERIKTIRIPTDVIPNDLLEQVFTDNDVKKLLSK